MQMPNSYAETQAGGDFIPVEIGAHYAIIKNVSERTNKNSEPMIVVSIDFDKKDKQANYFTEAFKKDVRPDKKYPNQAVNYINTEMNGKCSKGFKSFITCYAQSNGLDPEKGIKWGNDFAAQFKNKKIGVVYGVVEEEYNGEVKKRRKIRWFCDYNKVPSQSVPAEKLLTASIVKTNVDNNGFINVPTGDDEFIPFE